MSSIKEFQKYLLDSQKIKPVLSARDMCEIYAISGKFIADFVSGRINRARLVALLESEDKRSNLSSERCFYTTTAAELRNLVVEAFPGSVVWAQKEMERMLDRQRLIGKFASSSRARVSGVAFCYRHRPSECRTVSDGFLEVCTYYIPEGSSATPIKAVNDNLFMKMFPEDGLREYFQYLSKNITHIRDNEKRVLGL